MGYDPKQMDFASITNLAESRISGALGIPAIVAGLSAGLDSSTYNNLANLKKSAFEECLIPTWETFQRVITRQLLVDFERDIESVECEFDTSEIRALQENQGEKEARAIAAFTSGVTTLNECREQFGYDPVDAGDYYVMPANLKPITPDMALTTPEPPVSPQGTLPPGPVSEDAGGNPAKAMHPHNISLKGIDWNGLTLRRQPTELEARMLKQLDDAYQQGKVSMEGALLALRGKYLDEIIDTLDSLDPAEYYAATVSPSDRDRTLVFGLLSALFLRGASLIIEEIRNQGVTDIGDQSARPDQSIFRTMAGAIVSRIANDVQARGTGAAISAALLNQPVASTVRETMATGSTAYITRSASEATNWALSQGRDAEIEEKADSIEYLVYSAVLDNNTCQPCGDADGMGGQLGEIPAVPNPDCAGGAQCRCVHIPVVATEFKALYRGVEIDLKPTAGMQAEAERGLAWRKEYNRGGTAVGVARARDIINGKELSPRTVRRMYSFFSRHEVDKQGQGFSPGEDGYPSAGRIAWALWGGDAGFTWSKAKVKRMDKLDEGE